MEAKGKISKKNKNRFIFNNSKRPFLANNIILIILLYLFCIFVYSNGSQSFSLRYKREKYNKLGINLLSEIALILKGNIGDNDILYCGFYSLPDEIFINNTKIGEKNCRAYLDYQDNYKIKIKWYENLQSC